MKRLILTTASILALGLGGYGVSYAASGSPGSGATPGMAAPSGAMQNPSNGGSSANPGTTSMPSAAATSQPGYNANPAAGQWGTSGHMAGHSEVSEAQQKLQQEGLYHGAVDGIIGPETRQALRQYQQQHGLQMTANLDQQTLDHLLVNPSGGQGSSSPSMAPHHPSANNPNHPASGR